VETVASGAGVGLEFSCVYQVEGMTDQVQVSASAAQDGSVACDRVPGVRRLLRGAASDAAGVRLAVDGV
jgi:hypothetical protein